MVFNIALTVDALSNQYNNLFNESLTDFNKGNLKARIRMVTQYAIGGQRQLLVIGTTHATEALIGLTKRQGRALLQELGAEERLYLKMPTADLLDEYPGKSDEIELGVTYDQLDNYLEGKTVSKRIKKIIEKRYKMNNYKRQKAASMFDEWRK
ncbi:NAD(+) synthase [Bacillus wiedmannii]|nr:NAD(+) synthase [Bacillus wiedmannii]